MSKEKKGKQNKKKTKKQLPLRIGKRKTVFRASHTVISREAHNCTNNIDSCCSYL